MPQDLFGAHPGRWFSSGDLVFAARFAMVRAVLSLNVAERERSDPLTTEKWGAARAWLLLRLQELSDGVSGGMEALAAGDGHHLADLEELASDVSVDNMLFEQFRNSADTSIQIERALEKIEEGTYEQCDDCSGPVGGERLEALPFATQCVECRRRAEQESALRDQAG